MYIDQNSYVDELAKICSTSYRQFIFSLMLCLAGKLRKSYSSINWMSDHLTIWSSSIEVFFLMTFHFFHSNSLLFCLQWLGEWCGNTVQVWNILLHPWAGEGSEGVSGTTAEVLEQEDYYWDPTCKEVLPSWGIPPTIPCQRGPFRFQTISWKRLQWSNPMLWLSWRLAKPENVVQR